MLIDMHAHGALKELKSMIASMSVCVIQVAFAQVQNNDCTKGVRMLHVEYVHTPALQHLRFKI